jgi:hypothetical protein
MSQEPEISQSHPAERELVIEALKLELLRTRDALRKYAVVDSAEPGRKRCMECGKSFGVNEVPEVHAENCHLSPKVRLRMPVPDGPVTITARLAPNPWLEVLGKRLKRVVPPEGEEAPLTPEYVVEVLDELQEEWDNAERRLDSMTEERDRAVKDRDRVQDERAKSFRMLQEAVGGCGLTPNQPEADLEIEARIQALQRDRAVKDRAVFQSMKLAMEVPMWLLEVQGLLLHPEVTLPKETRERLDQLMKKVRKALGEADMGYKEAVSLTMLRSVVRTAQTVLACFRVPGSTTSINEAVVDLIKVLEGPQAREAMQDRE